MTMKRKLKALMADRKQKEIATRAGIHQVTLGTYINHGVIPGSDVAVRLAEVLGVDVGWLIDDRQNWPPVPSKTQFVPPAPVACDPVAA